eukprot:Gb_30116 [translate_table: standard]
MINDLPKVTLSKRKDESLHCITKEETSTKNIEETSDTSDSNEFQHKTDEPVSVLKNPLFKRKSKMVSNGHLESFKPPQPTENMNQTKNGQEELRHKQKPNNMNPFTTHPLHCTHPFHATNLSSKFLLYATQFTFSTLHQVGSSSVGCAFHVFTNDFVHLSLWLSLPYFWWLLQSTSSDSSHNGSRVVDSVYLLRQAPIYHLTCHATAHTSSFELSSIPLCTSTTMMDGRIFTALVPSISFTNCIQ